MKKLVLFALSALFFAGCIPGKSTTTPTPTPSQESEIVSDAESISAMAAAGKPLECVVTSTDKPSITTKIDGKKMKVVGTPSGIDDKTSNVISDGTYLYVWVDGMTTGTKFKLPSEEDSKEAAQKMQQQYPDFTSESVQQQYKDLGYTVNCEQKNFDADEFMVPTTIEFTDTSALMESVLKDLPEAGKMSDKDAETYKKMMEQYQQ